MGGDAIVDNIVPDDNIFALSKYALIFEQILDYLEGIPGVEVQGKSADRGSLGFEIFPVIVRQGLCLFMKTAGSNNVYHWGSHTATPRSTCLSKDTI